MFNYFFTNCNWIFENVFLRPFVHKVVFKYIFLTSYWIVFSLNVVEIFVHQVLLILFLMICFSNFSLVCLGNIDSWNFSLQNLGYVCFNYFEVVYVHWVIAKGVQSQALLGIQKACNTSQWWWFWSTQKLSIAIVIVKMIMFVVTQLLVNVFVKQHFSCRCCQKGLDISGTKCMCKVSYGDVLHCTMIRTSVEGIYWQDPSIYTNSILNIKGTKQVNMPFLWYS